MLPLRIYSVVYTLGSNILIFGTFIFCFVLSRIRFAIPLKIQFIFWRGCDRALSVFLGGIMTFFSSSSTAPSSLSVSESAFLFYTFSNFPFEKSLSISFHWMYLSSTPLRQCLFCGIFVSPIFGAFSVFLSF